MLFDNVYIQEEQSNGDILLIKKNIILDNLTSEILPDGNILLKPITEIKISDVITLDFKKSKIEKAKFIVPKVELENPSFKCVYKTVHSIIGDGVRVIKNSILNIKTIKYNNNGFVYYPQLGISIQGVDSNKALKEIIHQCVENKIELEMIILLDNKKRIKLSI